MLAFRILGTIFLSINLLINLSLIINLKGNTEESEVLAKIYLLLNSASTIFLLALMWVL